MNLKIVKILILVLISSASFGQTGTIRGTIKDAANKEDIIGGTVKIEGTQLGALTDINGFFEISKVPVGKVNISISYVSYKTKSIPNVAVVANNVTEINTFIEEDKTTLQEVKIVAQRMTNTEISVISEIKAAQQIVSGISADRKSVV